MNTLGVLREAISDSDLQLLVQMVDWAAIARVVQGRNSHNDVVLQRHSPT